MSSGSAAPLPLHPRGVAGATPVSPLPAAAILNTPKTGYPSPREEAVCGGDSTLSSLQSDCHRYPDRQSEQPPFASCQPPLGGPPSQPRLAPPWATPSPPVPLAPACRLPGPHCCFLLAASHCSFHLGVPVVRAPGVGGREKPPPSSPQFPEWFSRKCPPSPCQPPPPAPIPIHLRDHLLKGERVFLTPSDDSFLSAEKPGRVSEALSVSLTSRCPAPS